MEKVTITELKQFKKFESGRMVSYGYSISRDYNGKEISRTNPEIISTVGFSNSTPFTEKEYNRIMSQTFFE